MTIYRYNTNSFSGMEGSNEKQYEFRKNNRFRQSYPLLHAPVIFCNARGGIRLFLGDGDSKKQV